MNTLANNALFNILYRVLNVIFPLLSVSYVSRVLAPEGLGKIAYAHNIVSYFVMFAALGIPQYGTREIACRQNDPQRMKKLFSELLVLNFLSTSVCLVLYYLLVGAAFSGERILYLVFSLELLFNYINIDWLYQGREDYVYISLRSILVKVLSLILLVSFVKNPRDYVIYALITCLALGCNYIFNVFHARKFIGLSLKGLNLSQHIKPILILMLSSITSSLYCKVDVTMLGWMSSDAVVGYYANSHKIVNIILTLVTAVTAVFLPRLSYIYAQEREKYQYYLSMGVKIVLLLALPGCIGLILVAEPLVVTLFGGLFDPAAPTVQILAILIPIKGVGDLLCYQAIISSGNERHLVKSRILAGVANILLNSFLIPKFGQNGAALASVVSELIVNGMLLRYSLTLEKPRIEKGFLWSAMVSTGVMAVVVVLLRRLLYTPLLSLVVPVVAGAAVYLVVLVMLKNELTESLCAALKRKWRKEPAE